jgi:hypothetical protein
MLRVAVVAAVLAVVRVSPAYSADVPEKLKMPPAESGEIAGQPAILMWPISEGSGPGADRLLEAAGCNVYVAPDGDTSVDVLYPCGHWFLPSSPGKYRYWLESSASISTMPGVFHFGGGEFHGGGTRVLVPVVPAGLVKVSSPVTSTSVTVLSLGGPGYAFERHITPSNAAAGFRMPARRAVAAVFGPGGEALAVSAAFDVAKGNSIEVAPVAPKNSAVLAFLRRPVGGHGPSQAPATFVLHDATGNHPPDLVFTDPATFYLVWYDVHGSTATLHVDSKQFSLEGRELALRRGQVTTVRTDLVFASSAAANSDRQASVQTKSVSSLLSSVPAERKNRD